MIAMVGGESLFVSHGTILKYFRLGVSRLLNPEKRLIELITMEIILPKTASGLPQVNSN